jgi:hypothetical protein
MDKQDFSLMLAAMAFFALLFVLLVNPSPVAPGLSALTGLPMPIEN